MTKKGDWNDGKGRQGTATLVRARPPYTVIPAKQAVSKLCSDTKWHPFP